MIDALATAVVDDDVAEAGAIVGGADVIDADIPGCTVVPAPLFGLLGSGELFNPESLNNKYVPTYWHCMVGNGGSMMAGLKRMCILSQYTVALLICTTRYLT